MADGGIGGCCGYNWIIASPDRKTCTIMTYIVNSTVNHLFNPFLIY